MRRWRVKVAEVLTVASVCAALSACSTGTPDYVQPPTSRAPSSSTTHQASDVADDLLDGVRLPDEAARIAAPRSVLTSSSETLACVPIVAAHRFWLVRDHSVAAVESFLQTHAPGSTQFSATGESASSRDVAFKVDRGVGQGLVDITVTGSAGGTLVRADAQVVPTDAVCTGNRPAS